MKNLYILSGLGADKRIFQFITFQNCTVTFIDWIEPIHGETIEEYALRISEKITFKKPIILGVSFGGIMAVEVAKFIETEKIILIASAKTKYEIPFYYRIVGFLGLNKLVPINLLKKANRISFWFFGITEKDNKKLLSDILDDTNSSFLKWAINTIVNWKNEVILKNLKHIHGTADRILPIHFTKPDLVVKNGGHFMTINKFEELNQKINYLIEH